MGLGGEHDVQVLAGVGIVRLESQGFLELADRLVGLAFLDEGDAQVVVGLGVIRASGAGLPGNWRIASSVWPFWPRARPRL